MRTLWNLLDILLEDSDALTRIELCLIGFALLYMTGQLIRAFI